MLEVTGLAVGPLQANCYLVTATGEDSLVIVDPGGDADRIGEAVEEIGKPVSAIWCTHAHVDHVGAAAAVQSQTGAPISIHEAEGSWLADAEANLAAWAGVPYTPCAAAILWRDGDTFEALGRTWTVEHLPGHSPGHCAIRSAADSVAFSGDLIIGGGIGRVDLPGANASAMRASLGRAVAWPAETRLFGGHGDPSTIGEEVRGNAMLRMFLQEGSPGNG